MAKEGFTPEMKEWIALVVMNASRREIFEKVFHVNIDELSSHEQNKYDVKMWRLRKHPEYHNEWLKAFKERWGGLMAEAVGVLEEGLHDEQLPWRRTQHANLALAYGTKLIVGEEERAIHVKVEGMPDIGSPDDD